MIVQNTPPADAVAAAIAYPEGPVMLVDVGDNIGGGTPGDGTVLLAELLAQEAQEAMHRHRRPGGSAGGVRGRCRGEGPARGRRQDRRLARRAGPGAGPVRSALDGQWVHEGPENAGLPVDMGPTAVLCCGGVNLVL